MKLSSILTLVLFIFGCISVPVEDIHSPYKCPIVDMATVDIASSTDISEVTKMELRLDSFQLLGNVPAGGWGYNGVSLNGQPVDCDHWTAGAALNTRIPMKQMGWKKVRVTIATSYNFPQYQGIGEAAGLIALLGRSTFTILSLTDAATSDISVTYADSTEEALLVLFQIRSRCDHVEDPGKWSITKAWADKVE